MSPGIQATAQDNQSGIPQKGLTELEGVLEVRAEDTPRGEVIHYALDTNHGRWNVHVRPGGKHFNGVPSGSRVRIRGRSTSSNTLELGDDDGGGVTTLALAATNSFGEQRIAVILVNFYDNQAAPFSWSQVYNTMFGSVNNFYRETSYGQTWLTGDVFGWYTLPLSSSSCDTAQIGIQAEQAATNAGVNLTAYSRMVYVFPPSSCGFTGLGIVGGLRTQAWVNGQASLLVMAHELGHNLGLYHSKSQPCDTNGCSLIEYGDDHDIMGNSAAAHMNAYQKERLGWLNYGASPAIQTVTSSGTYWIDAMETPGGTKALKILQATQQFTHTNYYIETRAQIGFDAPYAPGVLIHTGNDLYGDTSQQIDMQPFSPTYDSVLDPGQSFSDASIGLTVTTISSGSSGAWISVQLPQGSASGFVTNGDFSAGAGSWTVGGLPDSGSVVSSTTGGALQFYRTVPAPGTSNQAFVFQQTGVAVGSDQAIAAQFDLGNSSFVRKRISVLLLDHDFSDLAVCTFWLPASSPMRTYGIHARTTKAWSNASIYFYAATAGSDGGAYLVDNVAFGPDSASAGESTQCVDPLRPAPMGVGPSAELLSNGGFVGSIAPWTIFGQLSAQLDSDVLEFFRPDWQPDPAGVILQSTGVSAGSGEILSAQFDLGNSGTTRSRVTVLVHDQDFGDLAACTFWIPPGQPLTTYSMRTYTTKPWSNATISIYDATPTSDRWIRLDNVSLRKTPGDATSGTDCWR